MAIYLGNFCNKKDVLQGFSYGYESIDDDMKEYNNIKILLAWYGSESYDGSAFVLFERDGKLYEVNGSHCSCYGLEGQWDPEETSVEELEHRIKQGFLGRTWYGDGDFSKKLLGVLKRWKKKHESVEPLSLKDMAS